MRPHLSEVMKIPFLVKVLKPALFFLYDGREYFEFNSKYW